MLIDTHLLLAGGSNIPRFEDDYAKSTRLLRAAVATLAPDEAAWITGKTALAVYQLST